jgi:hypothetical protein
MKVKNLKSFWIVAFVVFGLSVFSVIQIREGNKRAITQKAHNSQAADSSHA